MVTAAKSVYSKNSSILLGVVGIDVLMSELDSYGDNDTISRKLLERT